MKIFYDTEFLEDGKTIELISIGMVAEDGRELYAVSEEIYTDDRLHDRICAHRWLMGNVVPHLPLSVGVSDSGYGWLTTNQQRGFFRLDMTSNLVMPRRMIRNAVRDFILVTSDVELWAWYGAYDHVALAQLFGRMIDLPEGFPMWTNDLKQECQRLGNPQLPKQDSAEHNALADARWVRDAYAWIHAGESGDG